MELHQVVAPGLTQDFPALRTKGTTPTNMPPRLEPQPPSVPLGRRGAGTISSGLLHVPPHLAVCQLLRAGGMSATVGTSEDDRLAGLGLLCAGNT